MLRTNQPNQQISNNEMLPEMELSAVGLMQAKGTEQVRRGMEVKSKTFVT